MVDLTFQRVLFDATSRITNRFPRAGARILDATFRPTYGNSIVCSYMAARNRRTVGGMTSFRRFVIVPDIHIGDAMFAQTSLTAIRDFFPDAQVDMIVNQAAAPLLIGHPEATNVIPFRYQGWFPSLADVAGLSDLIRRGRYDLCVTFSPFIPDEALESPGQVILKFMSHSPVIIRNEWEASAVNHFGYQGYRFLSDLLSTVATPVRPLKFEGARTYHSDLAIEQARHFAADCGLDTGSKVIGYNPDAASKFTAMPADVQGALLAELARLDATILIGAGHTMSGIGTRLVDSLPPALRARTRVIPPSMPLDAYAALIDYCDVFITGDTGPLHLAAARRYSRTGSHEFRNRTAVLSVFGATTPRMSGYDSVQPGYLPGNQDAPSWCYTAPSPCRNISCLNKMFKTCAAVRCFEGCDVRRLAGQVGSYLDALAATRCA